MQLSEDDTGSIPSTGGEWGVPYTHKKTLYIYQNDQNPNTITTNAGDKLLFIAGKKTK